VSGERKGNPLGPVLKFGASVAAVVVGGVILEHVIRKMDRGLFHIPGIGYWRPGSEVARTGGTLHPQPLRPIPGI
jgi:hypothetical protein